MIKRLFGIINLLAKHAGYVYVFRYVNDDTGEDLIKIGVSDEPYRRYLSVKADLPGRLWYWGKFPVWSPYVAEGWLHRRFWDKKQVPRGAGPSAGKDEFFNLATFEQTFVVGFLAFKWGICVGSVALPLFLFALYVFGIDAETLANWCLAIQSARP